MINVIILMNSKKNFRFHNHLIIKYLDKQESQIKRSKYKN